MTAQGNALGWDCTGKSPALKGRHNRCFALSGLTRLLSLPTQGVALGYYMAAPSGRKSDTLKMAELKYENGPRWKKIVADFEVRPESYNEVDL